MIGRTHRFHGQGGLRAVYRRGKTVRSSLMSLRCATRDPGKPYRVAVVVSRKVSKSAVVRNRIRRRVYSTIRQTGRVAPGTDLIFTVFHDRAATIPVSELQDQIADLLQKAATTPSGESSRPQ